MTMRTIRALPRVRMLAAALAFVLALGVLVLAQPTTASADGGSISYYYNAHTRTFYRNPAGVSSPPGPDYRYTYSPLCGFNSKPTDDVMCNQAATYCKTRGIDAIALRVFRWQGTGGYWTGEPYTIVGVICPTPGAPATIPLAAVVTDIQQRLNRELTLPSAHLNPRSPGIVNLPVIAWADGPDAIAPLQITIPFPMTVTATAHYRWGFGVGTSAAGKGTAYDGTDPVDHPGHYQVTHAFSHAGTFPVTVTQTWDVQVFAPAIGGLDPGDLNIDAPAQRATRNVDVHALDVVLVN